MRPQGSGISFFTMSTGMADTYRSAVMDSPVSRLYCLQSAGQGRRGEWGSEAGTVSVQEAQGRVIRCRHSRRCSSVHAALQLAPSSCRIHSQSWSTLLAACTANPSPGTARSIAHLTLPSSFSSMFLMPLFMRTSPPRAAGGQAQGGSRGTISCWNTVGRGSHARPAHRSFAVHTLLQGPALRACEGADAPSGKHYSAKLYKTTKPGAPVT